MQLDLFSFVLGFAVNALGISSAVLFQAVLRKSDAPREPKEPKQYADSGQGALGFFETKEPSREDSAPVSENDALKQLEEQIERAKLQILRGRG